MSRTLFAITAAACFASCSTAEIPERNFVRAGALETAIENAEFKEITSVLVSHRGALISEQYFGDGHEDYLNDTRSATKSLTAMTMGAAIMDGHISGIDAPAFDSFAAERPYRFSSPLKDQITIRDLLTMSSALDCNDNVWESPGNEEHMYPAKKWIYFVLDMPTKQDYQRDSNGFGPFSYCTAGSFFLGQVIERAAGESIDKYIERRLLLPLGITNVNWDRSPSGEVMTGGGTELTSRGLLKLAELVRGKGVHEGKRLLPAEWTRELLIAHVKANDEQHYGYQWWRRDFRCGDGTASGWYMAGNGGNKIAIFEDLDLSVVVTAQLYGTKGMHQQSTDIIENYVLADHPFCSGREG